MRALKTVQYTTPYMSFLMIYGKKWCCILMYAIIPTSISYFLPFEVPRETEAAVILYVNWSAEAQRWLVGKFSSVCAFKHHITIT